MFYHVVLKFRTQLSVFVLTLGVFKAGGAGPAVRENVAVTVVFGSAFIQQVLKCESVSKYSVGLMVMLLSTNFVSHI